jgi:hypothetical protein
MPVALADTQGEARFFRDCPHHQTMHLHDDRNPLDLHAALYTTLGLSEVEVLRLVDWMIDLPLPGQPLRPFSRITQAVRAGYSRLPRWYVTRRMGELVDALQLPQLSLGDATATYSVAAGGVTGPGSGMAVRVFKLVDWLQHVTGDFNELSGRIVGRPHGLVSWSWPERAVDGAQWVMIKTFHHLGVMTARSIDYSLSGVEIVGGNLLNIWQRRAHQETTVFLRLPMEIYRAHELWILEHRSNMTLGSAQEFARSTHAALAHHHRITLTDWALIDKANRNDSTIVLMTTTRVMSRAPRSLLPYVVPAEWILDKEGSGEN